MSQQVSRTGLQTSPRAVAVCLALATLSWSAWTSPLAAQVRQYTPPGGAADEASGRKEALAEAVDEARWHAGPLRLDPAFWISDLAWVDRPADALSDSGSDLTGRIGAGLNAYLPVGSKTTFAAYALPEYVWWQDRAEERRVNQRFGIGSFTYFNRLAIAVTAERLEDFDFATGEILQRYTTRNDNLEVQVEVPILRRLTVYAEGADRSVESLVDDIEDPLLADFLDDLDRNDVAYRGGVRYYPSEKLRLGAGVGYSETDFADAALARSNSGDFWYVEAGYERPKLLLDLLYQENQLTAEDGAEFSDFESSTGGARIEWMPRESFSARLYGSRQLAYSLLVEQASGYVDQFVGAGVEIGLGWRLRLNLYGETGSHRYQAGPDPLAPGAPGAPGGPAAGTAGGDRVDDVESFGADLAIELPWQMSLRVGYQEKTITPPSGSGLPGQKISQILANLGFGFDKGTWY